MQRHQKDAAGKALRELLALRPDFAVIARVELGKRLDPELVGQPIDGVRKAGMEIEGVIAS